MPTTIEKSPSDQLVAEMPEPLRTPLKAVMRSQRMSTGVRLMLDRAAELGDQRRALLVGAMIDPISRDRVHADLDKAWENNRTELRARLGFYPPIVSEVVIGGGVHAAIYCAARAAKAKKEGRTFQKPLVLTDTRVGGTFAVTHYPSFYMNSRNRPGDQGVPGEGGALNLLPHAPLQPFDVTNTEYQTNSSMGDVVRLTLAMYARVVPGVKIRTIEPTDAYGGRPSFNLIDENGTTWARTELVVLATGLGEPTNVFTTQSDRLIEYADFMRRMESPFPLRGMRRVAVIGNGDGGRTVVEALLGQGPIPPMGVPSMDWVGRVDWYGVGESMNEGTWCSTVRPRYRNLGRFFRADGDGQRIRPRNNASYLTAGDDIVFVDGRPYDHVVRALGYTFQELPFTEGDYGWDNVKLGGLTVAKKAKNGYQDFAKDPGVYRIGPAAQVAVERSERLNVTRIPENSAAIFRYAPRTAALAASFSTLRAYDQVSVKVV